MAISGPSLLIESTNNTSQNPPKSQTISTLKVCKFYIHDLKQVLFPKPKNVHNNDRAGLDRICKIMCKMFFFQRQLRTALTFQSSLNLLFYKPQVCGTFNSSSGKYKTHVVFSNYFSTFGC